MRATSSGGIDSYGSSASFGPLQLESPVGKFLSELLVSHPHLLPAAVEQQLEQLKTDRDAENGKEKPSSTGTELILYRRIAEVKANERKRTLEEILYALIVQRFMDTDIPLSPTLSQALDPYGGMDRWSSSKEDKLERLHSPEAFEMIQNHLRLILGMRLGDSSTVASISKLRVGQVYAASVMYGYFLKRIDQRFQLEKTMRTLPWNSDMEQSSSEQIMSEESQASGTVAGASESDPTWSLPTGSPGGFGHGIKPTPLRTYVMSLDAETLQRYAKVRSKEAFSIIEKHTEALFGKPEIAITPQGTVDTSKDELVKISFAGLRWLIMEAVTFGSFLWDVENYVDARYHFVSG